MRHLLIPMVYGLAFCVFGMIVHKPRRESRTLWAFVQCIIESGVPPKHVAAALQMDPSQFSKIMRGDAGYKLPDLERLMDHLPYAVQQKFLPKLAEIALARHMSECISEDAERAS